MEALLLGAGLLVGRSIGVFTWPPSLEGRGDQVPVLASMKREFLCGEVLVISRKPGGSV